MEKNFESQKLPEEVLFSELMDAEKEVETILGEIGEILNVADDRNAAEAQLLKSHAPRLEEAQRKSREALEHWLEFVRSEIGKE